MAIRGVTRWVEQDQGVVPDGVSGNLLGRRTGEDVTFYDHRVRQ